MTLLTLSIIVLIAALPYFCRLVRDLREDGELYEKHAEEFFRSVEPLYEDSETPLEVLKMLTAVGWCITNSAGPSLLYHVFSNPRKLLEITDDDRRIRATIAEFLARRTELEKPYREALWNGPLAVSYRSLYYGSRIRAHLVAIETMERKQDIARAMQFEAPKTFVPDDCLPLAA